jgi:hypothetical protein
VKNYLAIIRRVRLNASKGVVIKCSYNFLPAKIKFRRPATLLISSPYLKQGRIFCNFKSEIMKSYLYIMTIVLLCGCNAMKKLEDSVYIQQRTSLNKDYPRVDSLLIVANGNSATRRFMEDVIPHFSEGLKKRGIQSTIVFIPYSDQRINEAEFDKQNYAYTLWIYEQDRALQKLDKYEWLVPFAMKVTDNRTSDNVWIATSIFNDIIKKRFYKEKYAGMLVVLFRANGLVR